MATTARKPVFASHHVSELAICSECGAAVGPGLPLRTHIDWHTQRHDDRIAQAREVVSLAIGLFNAATKVPRQKKGCS